MGEAILCPQCRTSVPADALNGVCPACKMQVEAAGDYAEQPTVVPANFSSLPLAEGPGVKAEGETLPPQTPAVHIEGNSTPAARAPSSTVASPHSISKIAWRPWNTASTTVRLTRVSSAGPLPLAAQARLAASCSGARRGWHCRQEHGLTSSPI